MREELAYLRIQQDLLLLVEYLSAVKVPDFSFLKGQAQQLLAQIEEAGRANSYAA